MAETLTAAPLTPSQRVETIRRVGGVSQGLVETLATTPESSGFEVAVVPLRVRITAGEVGPEISTLQSLPFEGVQPVGVSSLVNG